MTESDQQSKTCPYCGEPVKVSGYRCQRCGRSLAAAEQREWESSDPSSESSHESDDEGGIQISPVLAVACLIAVVAVALYAFFPDKFGAREKEEFPIAFSKPIPKSAKKPAENPRPSVTSYIRIHDASDSPAEHAAAPKIDPVETEDGALEQRERDEKIGQIADQVFEDLLRENALKPYTIHLKSGREIECDIIDESDARLTIKIAGMTAVLSQESIESIERPSSDSSEIEAAALTRATEIVDRGLVRDGSEWITPEEKIRRSNKAERRKKTARSEPPAKKTPESVAAKLAGGDFESKSDKEKLEALLSMLREKGELDADFFGGTLHIEDLAGEESFDDDPSFVSFEAQAEGLDVSQLFAFLKFDGAASGECNGTVRADFDQNDQSTLNGAAQVACEKMTLPLIDLETILMPPSKLVSLDFAASAENGTVVIERFNLVGTAYGVTGTATLSLSDKPEKSSVTGSFAIVLNEPPTLKGEGASAMGSQYMIDILVGSGSEILVNLSGPLSKPNVELTADTPLGAIVWKAN